MASRWNEQAGAIVLRIDNPKGLPEGIFSDSDAITFLKDGAFIVTGGDFAKFKALDALADAFHFGKSPLAFHQDARGVRWARLADFFKRPVKEIKVRGSGRFRSLDIDYETVVSGTGEWVSVDDIYARAASYKPKTESDLRAWGRKMGALADALVEPPARKVDTQEVRNVVVILEPPLDLPEELRVLGQLGDGTTLVVGPKSRGWVDALKADPGPRALRLIRGPVRVDQLVKHGDFEALDAAMRAAGSPMLVMPG